MTGNSIEDRVIKVSYESKPKPKSELFYCIMLKQMTDRETKEYHLKKLYELSLKSIGEIQQLEKPNEEKKRWVLRKLKAPSSAWRRCC